MTKKHSASKKFNKHSDVRLENITEYATAKHSLKKQMDKAMDELVSSPDNFEAVLSFGHKPLGSLGDVASEMLQAQIKFNKQVKNMQVALDALEKGLKNLDLDGFGEAAQTMLKGGTTKDLLKVVAKMTAGIPKAADKIDELTDAFDNIDSGIRGVAKKLAKLERERKDALHGIVIAESAANEVLRRYDADFIPAAQSKFDASKDAADGQHLNDLKRRREDFIDRMTILHGGHAGATIAGQQIEQMAEALTDTRKKIQDIQHNSKNEWKAMLAAAGLAGSAVSSLPAQSDFQQAAKKKPVRKKPVKNHQQKPKTR
jgi:uncharacterized protein YoxC